MRRDPEKSVTEMHVISAMKQAHGNAHEAVRLLRQRAAQTLREMADYLDNQASKIGEGVGTSRGASIYEVTGDVASMLVAATDLCKWLRLQEPKGDDE